MAIIDACAVAICYQHCTGKRVKRDAGRLTFLIRGKACDRLTGRSVGSRFALLRHGLAAAMAGRIIRSTHLIGWTITSTCRELTLLAENRR